MQKKQHFLLLLLLLSMLLSSVGLAQEKTYSFNFMDEDIRVVLLTLAKISDVDMVIDDAVKGSVTVKFDHATFNTALTLVTAGKELSYRKIGDSIIIEPVDMGITKITKLHYTRAVDIKKTLEPIGTHLKIKMEIDDISNALLITGSPTGCARIQTLVEALDILQQQVTLEAKIVAINKNNMMDLGMDWSWEVVPQYTEYTPPTTTTTTDPSTGITKTTATSAGSVTRKDNKGVIQFGHNPEGLPYEFYYQAKISALVSNGNAKILANPKVTTINGKEAHVFIGDHIPVLTETITNGKSATTTTYIDAGIKLIYTPCITADGRITTQVRTEVSTPTLVSDIKNYKVTTREAESTVSMKDGETMVIAGLIGCEESKTNNKVPFLSEIPFIGALFKSQHNYKNETEVVIFLTAKIVPF